MEDFEFDGSKAETLDALLAQARKTPAIMEAVSLAIGEKSDEPLVTIRGLADDLGMTVEDCVRNLGIGAQHREDTLYDIPPSEELSAHFEPNDAQ